MKRKIKTPMYYSIIATLALMLAISSCNKDSDLVAPSYEKEELTADQKNFLAELEVMINEVNEFEKNANVNAEAKLTIRISKALEDKLNSSYNLNEEEKLHFNNTITTIKFAVAYVHNNNMDNPLFGPNFCTHWNRCMGDYVGESGPLGNVVNFLSGNAYIAMIDCALTFF